MDKMKPILTAIRRHHFWVLCGAVILVALLCWANATADLTARTNARKSKLDGEFSQVRGISDFPNHPNDDVIKKTREQHEVLKGNVLSAWTGLYKEQSAKNDTKTLEEIRVGFKGEFEKRWGWPEKLENLTSAQEMDPTWRDAYWNHIKDHFPKLFELIDRRRPAQAKSAGNAKPAARPIGRPGEQEDQQNWVGIVDWPDAEKTLERFDKWQSRPSTLEVMLAQEDLWVYEALLKAIRNTNEGATDRKHAAIKRIRALEIGEDAVESWRKSESAVALLPAGETPAAGGEPGGPPVPTAPMPMPRTSRGPRAPRGDMPGRAEEGRISPLANRYVDDKGRPLADPTKQPYNEFRMIPVNIRVDIEQDKIPKLLVECANSNMPMDIRAVRLLLTEGSPLDLGGTAVAQAGRPGALSGPPGAGPRPNMGPGARAAIGPHMGAGGGPPREGAVAPSADIEEEAANVLRPPFPIEVQGIIYIYNPPDRSALGTAPAAGVPGPAAPASGVPAAPSGPARAPLPAVPAPVAPAATVPTGGVPAAGPRPGPAAPGPTAAPATPTPPVKGA
ncbi:MAG: hypothetical protein ABSG68_04135 [Thermoguttaceae bacterium]|jgi:hypothetical protein